MGRLSRHRKIKSCDPFHKGPKQLVDTSCNAPVQEHDVDNQPVPRKLVNTLFHKTRLKRKKGKTDLKKAKVEENLQRKTGEGKREYFERLDKQAAEKISEIMVKKRHVSQKRKEFLKARKERKSKKDASEHTFMEFREDQIKFGEVVNEPPKLTIKPRHADVKQDGSKSRRKIESLLLNSKLQNTKSNDEKQKETKEPSIKYKKRKHMSAIEQQKTDKIRLDAIQAYRNLKKEVSSKHQRVS